MHDVYRYKDFMKKFFESLREDELKKKMKLLTKQHGNHIKMDKYLTFVKKIWKKNCKK